MIKWLIKRFRPRPSVDAIVTSFNKTVRKLEIVAEEQEAEAKRQQEAAEAAKTAERNAQIEAARAKAVASNLNNLVAG